MGKQLHQTDDTIPHVCIKLRVFSGNTGTGFTVNRYFSMFMSLVQYSGNNKAGSYLNLRLDIAIQRGNAASILETLPTVVVLEELPV